MTRWLPVAVCFATALWAQYPPDTHWRKIETAHFQVVFPGEIESYAQHVANTLEALYTPLARTIDASPTRTTVILANQGVTRYVGGYVSLFPREAVFNTMPQQGFWGAGDWSSMLAARDGSYLVQIEKMNQGFGRLAKTLFGETGRAFAIQMTLPDWSINGQARVAETTLTPGGVGQFGSSETMTRALLMNNQHYSYMKAMHGSYKDETPDPAELGSFLVSHINRTSGPGAWDKILSDTAKNSWNPLALSMAMKHETGRSAATNYSETMSDLGERWKSQAEGIEFSQPRILTQTARSSFTGYYQPAFESDGSVLAQKSGLDTYPIEMVRIHPDGREERLFRMAPAVNGSNRTSAVNGKLVIDEYIPDMRWRRGYTEIVIRDVATGQTRRLTHRTRFMNPVLSPDGARIAVVEFLPDRRCSLVILDAANGGEIRRLPSPDNDMVYSPAWSEDGHRVAMVTQGGGGRALRVADIQTGGFQDAIAPAMDDIVNPVFFRDYVLYVSSYDGISNIYAVEVATGRRYRVTCAKYGANFPNVSADGSKLLYSDYTIAGYNLAELPLDPSSWTRIAAVPRTSFGYQGSFQGYRADAPVARYPVNRYSPSAHLFSVHSWGLTSGPPEVGAGLLSNDKMGLLDANASLIYDTNERTLGFRTSASYNRFFPVLDFAFAEQNRSVQFVNYTDNWTERTLYGGFHVPLNLSRGYYSTSVSLGAGVESVTLHGNSLLPLDYTFRFRRQRQSSPRDLAPAWAEAPWRGGVYTANVLSADGRFALPGLVRHHSVVLEGGYERQSGTYYFSSQIQFPRGYQAVAGPDFTKFSANYTFPFLYPDLSIGQLAYIKRLSGNFFSDYGRVGELTYRSAGVELLFDLGVLHFPQTLRAGVRYAYLLDYRSSRVQPFIAYSW
jgi:Tol biopolymer transport system component